VCITTAVSGKLDSNLKIGLYGDITSVEDNTSHTWKIVCLKRALSEMEEKLASFKGQSEDGGRDLAAGTSLIAFDRNGAITRAGTALPYYPTPPGTEPEREVFSAATELEFQKTDYPGALEKLGPLSSSKDLALGFPGALEGRIQK
jgi:hypothetical protein